MKWINTPKLIESIVVLIIIGLCAYGLVATIEQAHGAGLSPNLYENFIKSFRDRAGQRSSTGVLVGVADIPTPLDKWLDLLAQPGNEACDPEGTEDNGSLSYGALCFKEATFKMYVARYKLLPYAEGNEVMNWIGDAGFQHKLAKMMILEDWNNWRHWKTTVLKKIGYPPK